MRKAKVGFFLMSPESFHDIGKGTLRGTYASRKHADADRMVMMASEKMDVVFPGIIWDHDDVKKAINSFFHEEVDCVLVMYLSWAKDFTLNRFLRDMPPIPVLYAWCQRTEVNLKDTHDEDEFTEYLCCGSLVGSLEGSGNVSRYARPMTEIISGSWEEILDRMIAFANAARVRNELKICHVSLLASYNEIMWSTYVDPYSVFMKVGPELNFLSVAELMDCIEAVKKEEVQAVVDTIKEKYPVRSDVEEDKFFASVRATIGMERQAKKHHADLLVLNDIDNVLLEKVGLRPGFYPTNTSVDTVIVPEGDVGAGLAALFLKMLTGKVVHFIEPFHIDRKTDTFEGGHAGPNNYSHPDGKTIIARDVRFAKTGYKYAGAPFAWHVFPTGLKTMLHVSQKNGQFVMAITLVESLPEEMHLATYSHGRFRPVGETCKELFDKLLHIGVTQHYALVEGDVRREVLDLCHMLSFECHEV